MKKIILLTLSVILGLMTYGFLSLENYTQQQANDITDKFIESLKWRNFEPLSFGNLLYDHLHGSYDKVSSKNVYAGENTPSGYKNGIRKQVAENPQIMHIAVSVFGKKCIQRFEEKFQSIKDSILNKNYEVLALTSSPSELEKGDPDWWQDKVPGYYWYKKEGKFPESAKDSVYAQQKRDFKFWKVHYKKDSIEETTRWRNFTVDQFWQDQKKVAVKYDQLINLLLKLPDNQLNAFIAEVGLEQNNESHQQVLAKKTHAWLVKNKLIEKMPIINYNYGQDFYKGEQIWYLGMYPADLLLFAYRINKDYPKWTPRKILIEVKTLSGEVQKLMP